MSTCLASSGVRGTIVLANMSLINSSGKDKYVSFSILASSFILFMAFKSSIPICMNTELESLDVVKLYGCIVPWLRVYVKLRSPSVTFSDGCHVNKLILSDWMSIVSVKLSIM